MNPANSQAALAQLQTAQSTAQDPNTILSGQRQQLGVDAAQDTVTGLRGAINNTTKLLKQVAPSVMGRTASSLVTNAQATKQIGNEQAPLNQTLGEESDQFNEADRNLGKLQDRASQAASGIYQGQQDKLSYAQNLYNTLYQKEKDAEAIRQADIDRAEQKRQFDASLAASRNAGGGGFNLGGDPAPTTDPSGGLKNRAATEVSAMLQRRNTGSFLAEITAIAKSAGYGNTLDQAKLELLRKAQPGLFNSTGALDQNRVNALYKAF